MGGCLSVPSVVRSPVVKKNVAAYECSSGESKIRPSLVALTSNPYFAPNPRTHFSTTLGFPGEVFTTVCSKPDDLENSKTDFLLAADSLLDKANPAVPIATLRRNSLRLA